jgi:hypothetical protein
MKITKLGFFFFLFIKTVQLTAQQNTVVAGGESIGFGGSSSYTVGQVFYTVATGWDNSSAGGVQQPFETPTITEIQGYENYMGVSLYPNPLINYLSLRADDFENLSYLLIAANGELLAKEKISANLSKIDFEELPTATYFVQMLKGSTVLKTFKVVKY